MCSNFQKIANSRKVVNTLYNIYYLKYILLFILGKFEPNHVLVNINTLELDKYID